MTSLKDLPVRAPAYIARQRVVGADRSQHRCIEEVGLASGDIVVDVGCGPAYYLDRLSRADGEA
jgi:hypothetical protein